jgi:hypothetical protein
MRTVTVNLIGVMAPECPRQMVLPLADDLGTVRALVEEVGRRGGEALRRVLWDAEGRLERSVVVAVDGAVVDRDGLDCRLAAGEAAEISLFLIRPIFGGG